MDETSVFVQWKGTEACLDLHCLCGYHGHFDGLFAYFVGCGQCGRVYEMPHTFTLTPVDKDEPLVEAFEGPPCPPRDGPESVSV